MGSILRNRRYIAMPRTGMERYAYAEGVRASSPGLHRQKSVLPWVHGRSNTSTPKGLCPFELTPMPQSLSAVYIHLVFSTKERRPMLRDPTVRDTLHSYLGGISKQLECAPIRIG